MEDKGLGLRNISFKFGQNEPLFFNGINIMFESGKLHFIQGRNGSGKSTFFRIIDGEIRHNELISGSFCLNGKVYSFKNNLVSSDYKAQVKHVVQQVHTMLLEQMTVAQNMAFAHMQEYPFLKLFTTRVASDVFLKEAGIFLDQPVQLLSGGQKQLLAIIMSIHKAGQVLLLDEPTAALDEANAFLVMDIVSKIAIERELTVFIICHDQDISSRYCSGRLISIKKELGQFVRTFIVE